MAPVAQFVGLDLAWSPKNPTGACALDADGRIVDERMLGSDAEIVEWVSALVGGAAVVAIDAPLHVPNRTGRRPCETNMHRVYGGRNAGPHSSNRDRLEGLHGYIRGEALAHALSEHGFGDPWADSERILLEVYPHPALIEAFGLEERLKYKKGRVQERRHGLRQLAKLLTLLETANPPLVGDVVDITVEDRGKALKQIEDRLDARICAWIASVWFRRPDRMRVFGDRETGHIVVPTGTFADPRQVARLMSAGGADSG